MSSAEASQPALDHPPVDPVDEREQLLMHAFAVEADIYLALERVSQHRLLIQEAAARGDVAVAVCESGDEMVAYREVLDRVAALRRLATQMTNVAYGVRPRVWRVCECTQERACVGGCSWTDYDLCSTRAATQAVRS